MRKTRIDWCECTLNPVVGCPRGCEYCYAHKINDRFKEKYPGSFAKDFSKPEFFPERLNALKSKKPKSIFMNSMSDIAYWDNNALHALAKAVSANPQHKYITLTKEPLFLPIVGLPNVLYNGITVTTQEQFEKVKPNGVQFRSFLNIEPILEAINIRGLVHKGGEPQRFERENSAVIIGAETGNRKGKIIPRKEWVDDIVRAADERGLSVFMKNSLRPIMGDDFRQDKLPWEV